MLYAILIYGVDGLAEKLSEEEYAAVMQKHGDLQRKLQSDGTYRGCARLMSPTTAMKVEDRGKGVMVLDGPFTESKEQFLGFYMVECDTMEEAVEAAKALPQEVAFMEVRPVAWAGGLAGAEN